MTLDLKTRDDLHAVWNALQQFIDNSDPDECAEELDAATLRQRDAALALRDQCDAAIAALVN